MCKSWCEFILAAIILIFALWDTFAYSKWIVVIAAIIMIIHSFTCKTCFGHSMSGMKGKK